MAELIQFGKFVTASEREAASRLKELPTTWTVICNKEVVTPAGDTYEVDFVVIGDHVIFVIDEKSWSGDIYGNENVWVLPGGEPRRSPLQKIGHVGRQLAGTLRGRVPYLHEHAQKIRFVVDLILLSSPTCHLRIADPRISTHVVRLQDALEELPRIDRENPELDLNASRQAIGTYLTDLKNRPQIPQKINAYAVLEVMSGGRGQQDFLVQHSSAGRRLLRLYELNPVEQPREFVLREYNAVHRAAVDGTSPDVDPYFFWNEDRYIAIPFRLPEGAAFRTPAEVSHLQNPKYALELAAASFRQLSVLHKSGMVHRRLDPESIYANRAAGALKVQFFNFMFAHIDERQSIATELDQIEKDNPYLSPECRIGFALGGSESDVYGLALSLCSHLGDIDPSQEEADGHAEEWVETALRGRLGTWPGQIADRFVALLRECASQEPRSRPTPTEVSNELKKLSESWASLQAPPVQVVQTLGGGQYRIIRVLGEGATAVTYLVEDTTYGGEFVLKRIKNVAAVQRYAKAEFNTLKDLSHLNLPRIYDVRQPQDDFHLKLEYIPGSELTHCMDQFHHRPDRLLHLANALLTALGYLEEHGISHRDIAPKNIIVSDEDQGRICLIDFGLAKFREDMRQSAVGTPLYRDPQVETKGWNNASDLYSVAVVLYESLTGQLPFVCEDGIPKKREPRPLPIAEETACGLALLQCLRCAAGLVGERYPNAPALLQAIEDAVLAPELPPEVEGTDVVLEWIQQLRGLYRNSATGNADNRGLDSDFARDTYVPTLLDRSLLPDIVDGKRQLVFLTGNPGDGKTAFLEKVRDHLKRVAAAPIREDRYGWVLDLATHRYEAIYDASESREERSSDNILSEAFAPFSGETEPELSRLPILLIAINDGRLYEFFEAHRADYGWLAGQIDRIVFDDGAADQRIAVVDLKRRALVQLPHKPPSLFSRMLDSLVLDSRWKDCLSCVARIDCPIKFNADSLRNPTIAKRIERLFLIQHWRRTRRATIRDVRSALAYFITGNLACDDVHRIRSSGQKGRQLPLCSFFHAAFNARHENDEMLSDLAAMDPAQRVHPRLDRFLHFNRNAEKWRTVLQYMGPVNGRAAFDEAVSPEVFDQQWHGAVKRRLYFEGDDARLQNDKWELPPHGQLLPYLYLDDFVRALTGEYPADEVLKRLLAGMSRSEGITRHAAGGKLSVALCRNLEQELTVIKQFEPEHFRCRVLFHDSPYVETIPDSLELFHISGDPKIEVTLDLFEVLSRLAEGYTPETQEFEPFLIELREFKSRLLRTGVKEVLLLEGRSRRHRVVIENHVIELKEAL
jgi:serine/threonine protein kinase